MDELDVGTAGRSLEKRLDTDSSEKESDLEEGVPPDERLKTSSTAAAAPPEGGLRGYLAVAGSTAAFVSTFGLSNCYGVLQDIFETSLLKEHSTSAIAACGSIHLFCLFGSGIYAGRLFDRGYFQYQLAAGSVLWLVGIFCLSLSKEYYQVFLSYAVCMGLGMGALFAPTLSNVGTYFLRRRGIMCGIVASGASFGAVVFPIMLNHLFPRIGFASTIRIAGYIMLALLGFANAVVRPRKMPPKEQERAIPLIVEFLGQPTTWAVSMGAFFCMMGLFLPVFYLQTFAVSNKLGRIAEQYSLTILNSTSVVFRIVAGFVGDKFGIINTLACMSLVNAVMVLGLIGAKSQSGLIAIDVLYGISSSFQVSLMVPGLMTLARGPHELGTRSGLGLIFVALSTGSGAPLAGALFSAAGGRANSYWAVFLFGGLCWTAGCVCYSTLRFVQSRRKQTWKV